jgi:DNA-binding MarR family transcriptional regulator
MSGANTSPLGHRATSTVQARLHNLPERAAGRAPDRDPAVVDDDQVRDDADLLRALGLSGPEAAVLVALGREGDSTAAALAALTGLRRPQVSAAVQRLEQVGLVEVVRNRRPHPLRLAPDPGRPVAGLLRALESDRQQASRRADEAAELLRRQAAALARQPRARPLRRLTGVGPGADHDLLVARRTYDEVALADSATVRRGVPLYPSRAVRRLLVVGEPPDERRRWWVSKGVDVRSSSAELPLLVVVDGGRARVEVGTTAPGRTAWTFDRAQVQALQQLFELWWLAAGPAR